MRIIFPTILLSALLACSLSAQVTHYQIRFVSANPSGSCAPSYITINRTTGAMYGCVGGTWTAIGGSGSPTGSAGGVLAGTYPNPAFANPNAATGPVVLDAFGAANLANPGVFYVAPPGGAPTEGSTLGSDGLHTPRITLGTSAVAGTIDAYEGVPAFVPSVSTQALFLDPTTHHLRRKNNSSTIVDLETPTAANVILGFSGTCNSSSAMMGDGTCAAISSAYTAITGLSLGDTLYGSGSATAKLAGSTSATKQFYTQTGTGSVSAAPAWGTLASGDLSGTYSLGTGYLSGTKTAGSGGVTANLLVKIDSTGNVVLPATSDVGILGVAVTTASAAASVEVATRGIINCVADNTTVIGNMAIVGTTTAGRCRDSGQTSTILVAPTTQIVGKFLSVASAGSNASVQLYGPGHYGALFATVATTGLASDLTGSLADARLSANVALLNGTTTFTTAQSITQSGQTAGASVGGLSLINSTAASSGNQQYSPGIILGGQGWKTTATAASQPVTFKFETIPVQGSAAPTSSVAISNNVNGGAYTQVATIASDGGYGATNAAVRIAPVNGNTLGVRFSNSAASGNLLAAWNDNGSTPIYGTASGVKICSSSSTTDATLADTCFYRNAAGVWEINNATAGTYRELKLRSLVIGGTVPGISGCSAGTQTGGATVGTYSSGTTGTCTVVLTFGFTAPTGWSCMANDRTTPADLQNQTASSTTTATIAGATITGDVINYQCVAY